MSSNVDPNLSRFSQGPDAGDSAALEPDPFEPSEESEPQQDPEEPVTGDGAEGYPIRGGSGASG